MEARHLEHDRRRRAVEDAQSDALRVARDVVGARGRARTSAIAELAKAIERADQALYAFIADQGPRPLLPDERQPERRP